MKAADGSRDALGHGGLTMKRHAAFTLIELPFDGLRAVRKRKSKAFTLIELLIVVGILGVLVTILVPVVGGQIEQARRTNCRANLKAIGQKMAEYSQDHKGRFPAAAAKSTGCLWAGKTDGITFRMTEPTTADDTSVTASQWLLVRAESVPVDAFICPSTNDTADDFTDNGDVKQPVSALYDFKSPDNISYSFFMPYGKPILSLLSKPGMAIGADKSPFFDNATGTAVGVTPAANSKTNSSNNHRQAGQNVVFPDGRAAWFEYANAGISGDNIYTRFSLPEDQAGGLNDPEVGAIGDNYAIEVTGDSVLAP